MSSNAIVGFSDADAATLASVVHEVVAAQAQITTGQARLVRALASGARLAHAQESAADTSVKTRDMALRAIAAELAAALRTSDRSMQRQIDDAETLVEQFPATLDAFQAGAITRAHARLITELGLPLPPEARAEFEQLAVIRAEEETANRLRGELGVLAERLHPRTFTERHAEAREQRCVRITPLPDGMSELIAVLPTLLADAIHDRLTRQGSAIVDARRQARERVRADHAARAQAGTGTGRSGAASSPDGATATADAPSSAIVDVPRSQDEIVASDTRSIDQLRADIFADMLLTAQPGADPTRDDDASGPLGAIRATVQVVVPALTLLDADQHPADLVGRSPIDADTARRLAGASSRAWTRLITDPVRGTVLHTDARFPTPAMRRHLHARDNHCRFPGCRVPAIRCEADHTVDHSRGGPTHLHNLEMLCQRHHSMKQFTAWRVRQLDDGVLEWTSPLGVIYTDTPPPPTVHFVPDDESAAATEDEPPPF